MTACTSSGDSVMHDRALKTHEFSCVARTGRPFFIPVVHSPSGVMGHVVAPELSSQEDRAPSHGTRDSIGTPLSRRQRSESWDTWQHHSSPLRKAGPEAMGHMAAPELTSSMRQWPEPRDTWQRRSSLQQGGEIWGRGTRGGVRAHLCRKL
jgi:hypothetical protein